MRFFFFSTQRGGTSFRKEPPFFQLWLSIARPPSFFTCSRVEAAVLPSAVEVVPRSPCLFFFFFLPDFLWTTRTLFPQSMFFFLLFDTANFPLFFTLRKPIRASNYFLPVRQVAFPPQAFFDWNFGPFFSFLLASRTPFLLPPPFPNAPETPLLGHRSFPSLFFFAS